MELKNPDKRIFFELEYERVFEEAISALEDCGFEIKKANKLSGSITATTPMSVWSWGERMKVSVSAIGEGVQVIAQSKGRLPTQIFDLGINKKNVNDFFSALVTRARIKKTTLDQRETLDKKERLLRRASYVLNSIIKGLEEVDLETRQKIMELCGEACAREDKDLEIARRIAAETADEEQILSRVNKELSWCGTWVRKGDTIQSTCTRCECPLVRNRIVDPTGTFCYCSKGWVKSIFEIVLKKPITVELEDSIGGGGEVCKFMIYPHKENWMEIDG